VGRVTDGAGEALALVEEETAELWSNIDRKRCKVLKEARPDAPDADGDERALLPVLVLEIPQKDVKRYNRLLAEPLAVIENVAEYTPIGRYELEDGVYKTVVELA
jgi:hypothetical protein